MEELDRWATGRLLSAAARLVEHEWNTHLSQWDLNHASLAVLHVLLGGPQTQRDLAAAVQVEDQTMSRTVERLERSGYVERHRDESDRRRVVVSLTPEGRSTCLRASDVEVAEGYFRVGVDDVPALRRALAGIIQALSSQRWPGSEARDEDTDGEDTDGEDTDGEDTDGDSREATLDELDDPAEPGRALTRESTVG
jgi:MarR family transcriptional regulator, organic hydroperoxide resistance regulator